MIILLLFLQKQNLALAVYLFTCTWMQHTRLDSPPKPSVASPRKTFLRGEESKWALVSPQVSPVSPQVSAVSHPPTSSSAVPLNENQVIS
jgi:hypothetical protein